MLRLSFAAAVLASAIAMPAAAQTQLELEYAKAQQELQAAIRQAAGSTRAALVLPISALENPFLAESVAPIAKDPESHLAMEGYDPVGYFSQGEAILGDPAYRAEYDGAVFFFASAEHRDMFAAAPEKYVPAFGGYCTETIAMGALTPASPLHWTVHGDRLYLTRSEAANEAFREHRGRSIEAANEHWALADAFRSNANFKATRRGG